MWGLECSSYTAAESVSLQREESVSSRNEGSAEGRWDVGVVQMCVHLGC